MLKFASPAQFGLLALRYQYTRFVQLRACTECLRLPEIRFE
jgi:hypothetical protein